MDEHELTQPFFLIVIDEDRGVFSVEGPMTDGRPWQSAARKARKHQHRRIVCGATGPDRDALADPITTTVDGPSLRGRRGGSLGRAGHPGRLLAPAAIYG
jgi:hypothetical protein